MVERERRTPSPADAALIDARTRRYRDPTFAATAVKVLPGECYVTDDPSEMLVTVLGSCVAACIRDPVAGVGGMNHFMLATSETGRWGDDGRLRYGNFAMDELLAGVLARGGVCERLEVKAFGGANVLVGPNAVGADNAAFLETWMAVRGLTLACHHLRGSLPRRVHYFPVTGRVMVRELRRASDLDVLQTRPFLPEGA